MRLRGIRDARRAVHGAAAATRETLPLWVQLTLAGVENSAESVYLAGLAADAAARTAMREYVDRRIAKAAAEAGTLAGVITDSGRDCDQANPQTGAWCHKSGAHKTHRDTDGATWDAQ
jgi:hypothetical protein